MINELSYIIYFCISAIFVAGLFGVFLLKSNVKKILSLAGMQNALIALFLVSGYVKDSVMPIHQHGLSLSTSNVSDPVPSVLMLTAIVVGFCLSCLGYAFAIKLASFKNDKK